MSIPEHDGDDKNVVGTDDPRAAVWESIRGQWRFSALYAFVDLGLAGLLRDGPQSAAALAEPDGGDQGIIPRRADPHRDKPGPEGRRLGPVSWIC